MQSCYRKYRKYMGCKSMFLILPQIWDGKVLGRKPAELSIPLSCFEGTGCTVLKFEFGIGSGTAKNIYNFIYIYIYLQFTLYYTHVDWGCRCPPWLRNKHINPRTFCLCSPSNRRTGVWVKRPHKQAPPKTRESYQSYPIHLCFPPVFQCFPLQSVISSFNQWFSSLNHT